MKNTSFLMILAALTISVQAQTYSGKVAGHNKGDMDVVLTMLGLDNLIKIGTLNASGELKIDLSADLAALLTADEIESSTGDLRYGFQFVCGNFDDFPEGRAEIARDAGIIALWTNDTWAGTLFPVTDEKLQFWIEDDGYNDAVEASFYKILLVTEDVELNRQCNSYNFYDEKNVEVSLDFDIRLKKGFNLIEYQLQSVFKTDPNVRASFPDKVKITNPADNTPIIWLAKYYY